MHKKTTVRGISGPPNAGEVGANPMGKCTGKVDSTVIG